MAGFVVLDKITGLSVDHCDTLIGRARCKLRTIRRWLHLSDVASVGVVNLNTLTLENGAFMLQELIRLTSREKGLLLSEESAQQSVEVTINMAN